MIIDLISRATFPLKFGPSSSALLTLLLLGELHLGNIVSLWYFWHGKEGYDSTEGSEEMKAVLPAELWLGRGTQPGTGTDETSPRWEGGGW